MTSSASIKALLILTIVLLAGCGGGGGGGSDPDPVGSSNWDSMKWDQDNWS